MYQAFSYLHMIFLKTFLWRHLLERVTRRMWMNNLICIYYTDERENRFFPLSYSWSHYCRKEKIVCCFRASFVLNIKAVNVANITNYWSTWLRCSWQWIGEAHLSLLIHTLTGAFVHETVSKKSFFLKHELQQACQAFMWDGQLLWNWQSLEQCLESVTGCCWLELMTIF